METRNKILFIPLLVVAIAILISQNFTLMPELDWVYYYSVSGWVDVSWQDSFFGILIPFMAYFPTIAGALGILATVVLFSSARASRILFIVTGVLAILAFVLFYLFGLIFIFIIGNAIPFPNLPGAFLCLGGGIAAVIMFFLIKKPYSPKGHAPEDKDYYAIDTQRRAPTTPSPTAPTISCPKCGGLIQADQTFCEHCGEFL